MTSESETTAFVPQKESATGHHNSTTIGNSSSMTVTFSDSATSASEEKPKKKWFRSMTSSEEEEEEKASNSDETKSTVDNENDETLSTEAPKPKKKWFRYSFFGKSRKDQTVTDFVDEQFSEFNKKHGIEATKENTDGKDSGDEEENSKDPKKQQSKTKSSEETTRSAEDEEACITLTYLALLTSLYLPLLLFLWIRRSVSGAGSLIRSLFLGHILRLILAFLLLPPSTTKTLVPTWMWNGGVRFVDKCDELWNDRRLQSMIPGWVHLCLGILLGVNYEIPSSSPLAPGNSSGGGVGVGILGGSVGHHEGIMTFPPALTALVIFTVLVFVVHPDGLTWIVLSRLRDGIESTVKETAQAIRMLRNGTLKLAPIEISGIVFGIILIYTILHTFFKSQNSHSTANKHASANSQREKGRHKHKKGKKKGGGRNHHHHSNGGNSGNNNKSRIRGGHYRKDLYTDPSPSPTAANTATATTSNSSRARSLSPRHRCDSDMEETTVSVSSDLNMHVPSLDGTSSSKSLDQKKTNTSEVQSSKKDRPSDHRITSRSKTKTDFLANEGNQNLYVAPRGNSNPTGDSGGKQQKRRNGKRGKKNQPSNSHANNANSFSPRRVHNENKMGSSSSSYNRPSNEPILESSSTTTTETLVENHSHHQNHQRLKPSHEKRKQHNQRGDVGNHSQNRKSSTNKKSSVSVSPVSQKYDDDGQQSYSSSSFFSSSPISSPQPYQETNYGSRYSDGRRTEQEMQYAETNINSISPRNSMEEKKRMSTATKIDPPLQPAVQWRDTVSSSTPLSEASIPRVEPQPTSLPPSSYVAPAPGMDMNHRFSNVNVPNIQNSYSHSAGPSQYGPGKLELAAFLIEVQLPGAVSKTILDHLESVNDLERLSDEAYGICGIDPVKRLEIRALLEARNRRQMANVGSGSEQGSQSSWVNNNVPPPPGLGMNTTASSNIPVNTNISNTSVNTVRNLGVVVPNLDQTVSPTASNVAANNGFWNGDQNNQQMQYLSSYSSSVPATSASNSGYGFQDTRSLPVPQCNVNGPPARVHAASTANDSNFRMSGMPSLANEASNVNNSNEPNVTLKAMHSDEKIEADMQELGGQMAGSILDF